MIEVTSALPSYTIRQDSPDGRLFVHVIERDGTPVEVRVNIGKAGTNMAAWADAIGRLITRLLPHIGIHGVIEELSGITSQGIRLLEKGNVCRSGPEGIAIALMIQRRAKFEENKPKERPGRAGTEG